MVNITPIIKFTSITEVNNKTLQLLHRIGLDSDFYYKTTLNMYCDVKLRLVTPNDNEAYMNIYCYTAENAEYMRYNPQPRDHNEIKNRFQQRINDIEAKEPPTIGFVCLNADNDVTGFIIVYNIAKQRSAEIGYTILQKYSDQKIATKSVSIVISLLKECKNLNLMKVIASADKLGVASQKVMQKNGFVQYDEFQAEDEYGKYVEVKYALQLK